MTQFITHVATAGERWDLLAWKYYGDPSLYALILEVNWPRIMLGQLSADPVFSGGETVYVPILLVNPAQASDLPPWKQQQ